ncbi:MAG TPA: sensor domain-containing protein [Pseudonocardiaceae bacterium]
MNKQPWPPPPPRNPLRALVSAQTWLSTSHLVTDWMVGTATFTVAVTGLALSVGMLPVFGLGVPVFVLLAHLAMLLGMVERGRYRLTMDVPIPAPPRPRTDRGVLRHVLACVTSGAVWRQLGYQLLLLPLGVLNLVVTSVAWALPITMIAAPAYVWATPGDRMDFWLFSVGPFTSVLVVPLGAGLLLAVPYVVHALAVLDAAIARALLGRLSGEALEARVGELEQSRSRMVDAAELERRRIERDLHDGAQQQLVSLAMNLGMAKAQFADDPERARELIEAAHADAKQAIIDLRNLTRGIHPPVLTDLGLDAALSALAARCPVPVSVDVEARPRPTPTIEAIAYFVVAEALTNVARHSGATAAAVRVRRDDNWLRLVVSDNGLGGADLTNGGTGLAGLADRLSAVDGRITMDSPLGGPTVLVAELPCAS